MVSFGGNRSRTFALLCALAVVAMAGALSGCSVPLVGSSGENPDKALIDQLVNRTFTTNDPTQCTQDFTLRYDNQMFGRYGADPIEACRNSNTKQSMTSAEQMRVESLDVNGDVATARAAASGGFEDGAVLTFNLVRVAGRWKLDWLANVQFDRPRLDQAIRQTVIHDGYKPQEADCMVAKMDRVESTDELERQMVIGGDEHLLDAATERCLGDDSVRRDIANENRRELKDAGVPPAQTDCAVSRINHSLTTAQLRSVWLTHARGDSSPLLRRVARAANLACARELRGKTPNGASKPPGRSQPRSGGGAQPPAAPPSGGGADNYLNCVATHPNSVRACAQNL